MTKPDASLANAPCTVCRGTGITYLEHADGSLSEKVCPACRGEKNQEWRHDHWEGFQFRRGIPRLIFRSGLIVLWGVLCIPRLEASHNVALWIFLCIGGLGLVIHACDSFKVPKKKTRRDPLTTETQKNMIGGLGAATVLKMEWDEHRKRDQQ